MKRKTLLQSVIATALLGAFVLAGGCQTPGGKSASTCPLCGGHTSAMSAKGLDCDKMVCPECKGVETDAAKMSAALAAYTGADSASVQVCEHCNAVVMTCPKCAKK